MLQLDRLMSALTLADPLPVTGRVIGVTGLLIEATGPLLPVGEVCVLGGDGREVWAEVVGFRSERVLLMPLGETEGIRPGWLVSSRGGALLAPTGRAMLGRVIDGLGRPLDGRGPLRPDGWRSVTGAPPDPLSRQRITTPLSLGVRAIDGLITCGQGQRVGIFAGSGVGKSTLLGMIARSASADCNVIALIGERGREVREFIERDLGEEGLKRSVVVVATSDQASLVRIRAALLATAIAEAFRDEGANVMLMMDSVTRLAQAQREVGLSVGEPPTTRGYTPSVFTLLPKLLERSGTGQTGSVTGLYTVLVDGDDMNEPVADTVRGILDGHVVLSRKLAQVGHFPAVDVLASVSRVMPEVSTPAHQAAARRFRGLMAAYKEAEDLIQIGAYQPGANPKVDEAQARMEPMRQFLQQEVHDRSDLSAAVRAMAGALGEE